MANTGRYRYGETRPVSVTFDTALAIQIGDLVWIDASDSYNLKAADENAWVAAQAAPSAPTLTDNAVALGTALTNAVLTAKASYVTDYGETEVSSAGSATPTNTGALRVTAITMPAGMRGVRYYVETASASGVWRLYAETLGETFLITGFGAAGAGAGPTTTTLGATVMSQADLVAKFAGVAMQTFDGTTAGLNAYGIKDGKLRVATAGVFEFDTASASYKVGDLVGPAKQTGNLLEPQKVVAVANEYLSIGRVVKETSSQTTVFVEIQPKKLLLLK